MPSNLHTIRPDGTELMPITTFGPGETRASHPSWTADGRIIFTDVTGAADERQSPAFIGADGSGLQILTGLENLVHSRLRPVSNR